VVPIGRPRPERADAARNREHLLDVAREMLAERGPEAVTMDCLAERAGLGKGTVFRRFGTRAGIFRALLDEDDRCMQQRVLSGPPPLGPGADPVRRLIAYGRARIDFLFGHHAIVRATLDSHDPAPAGATSFVRAHIRMLVGLALPDLAEPGALATQLTAALDGPLLLYLGMPEPGETGEPARALGDSWQFLIERVCRRSSEGDY
jgi:polyketide synthase 12